MPVFEVVVSLLLLGAVLAAIARRAGIPYPALVAIAGASLALLPQMPSLVLDPELALALFVAPVLVDAAFDASQRDLRDNWRAVTSLALGAVVLTVIVVAIVARALVPDMPWAAAIALGAIVAPPDASAATAVLKELRPPHRLLVILEGESLFNDASALLIYRLAVGAAATGIVSAWAYGGTFLAVAVGSVLLALLLAPVVIFVTVRVHDVATAVIFQFCSTFAAWMLAERLGLSAIFTMVVLAMALSRPAAKAIPSHIRLPAFAVWEVAVFVLNVLAFILVGFQLRQIFERTAWTEYVGVAAAVCVTVIVARLAWVVGTSAFSRWRCRPSPDGTPGPRDVVGLSAGAATVVGWCGMRGIVTLAAALALPVDFPQRDLLFFTAFAVVLVTLVLQGGTLRFVLRAFALGSDDVVEREIRLARLETIRAALEAAKASPGEGAELLRRRYEHRMKRLEQAAAEPSMTGGTDDLEAVRTLTSAERRRLIELRDRGDISDAAFQQVEKEIDIRELALLDVSRA